MWFTPWISPCLMETSIGCPPAFSTAFHGSVSSICSTPSVARKAIFMPFSSLAMLPPRVLGASLGTYPRGQGTNGTKATRGGVQPASGAEALPAAAGLDVPARRALVVGVLGFHRGLANGARRPPGFGDRRTRGSGRGGP